MDREEYISQLGENKNHCSCPELSFLYGYAGKIDDLLKRCLEFQRETDFSTVRKEDIGFLEKYHKVINESDKAMVDYFSIMEKYIESSKLKLKIHELDNLSNIREGNLSEAKRLSKEGGRNKYVFTIHCSICDSQLDTIEL